LFVHFDAESNHLILLFLAKKNGHILQSVMATDIVDKDLKALRNARWDKAFKRGDSAGFVKSPKDEVNRKATIVIEHIIQVSDRRRAFTVLIS
jgi:hypothetical protein